MQVAVVGCPKYSKAAKYKHSFEEYIQYAKKAKCH